eukprot:3051646-Prorocentrum_lima.AAC.1
MDRCGRPVGACGRGGCACGLPAVLLCSGSMREPLKVAATVDCCVKVLVVLVEERAGKRPRRGKS